PLQLLFGRIWPAELQDLFQTSFFAFHSASPVCVSVSLAVSAPGTAASLSSIREHPRAVRFLSIRSLPRGKGGGPRRRPVSICGLPGEPEGLDPSAWRLRPWPRFPNPLHHQAQAGGFFSTGPGLSHYSGPPDRHAPEDS